LFSKQQKYDKNTLHLKLQRSYESIGGIAKY